MSAYSLKTRNETEKPWTFVMFQQYPGHLAEQVHSLAWMTLEAEPSSTSVAEFRWGFTFDFIWADIEHLKPGVVFTPTHSLPAGGLASDNKVDFDKVDGQLKFYDQETGPGDGLWIMIGPKVPLHQAAVGFAMSGQPTFVRRAIPNDRVQMGINTDYYIAAVPAGSVRQGEVLDVLRLPNVHKVSITSDTYTQTGVFKADRTWAFGTDL